MEQVSAWSHFHFLLAFIDVDFHLAFRGEIAFDNQQKAYENQGDDGEDRHRTDNCNSHFIHFQYPPLLELNTHKSHKCHTHQTHGDESDAEALERGRHV